MITRRAILVIVVGVCFYLIALVNVLPSFYYALAWLMAGMLVSSLGLAFMSLSGLQCQWRSGRLLAQEEMNEGHEEASAPSIFLDFSNYGTLNKTGVIVEVLLHCTARKSTFKRSYLLEALTSGNSIATEVPLLELPRGEYRLQELRLVGSDVLGLFRVTRTNFRMHQTDLESSSFVVGPALLNLAGTVAIPASASSWSGPGSTKWGQHSDEIRGIRSYEPGDDLRDVHWRSTARMGKLVVKEYTRPLEQRILVVWDGHFDLNRQEQALEWSLRFCASLVQFAIDANIPCSLLCLGAQTEILEDADQNAVPLTLISSQGALARAEANRLTSLGEAMRPYLPLASRFGQLDLITPAMPQDSAAVLAQWRSAGGAASALHLDIDKFSKHPGTFANIIASRQNSTWPTGSDASYASARNELLRYMQTLAR